MAVALARFLHRPRKAAAVLFWFVTTLILACVVLHWQVQRRVALLAQNLEEVQSQNSELQQQLLEMRRLKDASDNAHAVAASSGLSDNFARRLALWHIGRQSSDGCLPVPARGAHSPMIANMSRSNVVDGRGAQLVGVTGAHARLPSCFIISGHLRSQHMTLEVRSCSSSKNLDGTAMTNQVTEYLFLNAGAQVLTVTDGTRSFKIDARKAVFAQCAKTANMADHHLYFLDDESGYSSSVAG